VLNKGEEFLNGETEKFMRGNGLEVKKMEAVCGKE
jgi:hypothetical protein